MIQVRLYTILIGYEIFIAWSGHMTGGTGVT